MKRYEGEAGAVATLGLSFWPRLSFSIGNYSVESADEQPL